jgi:fluoride exporter
MNTLLGFFLVGLGGAVGAMTRHGVSLAIARAIDPSAFPVGTLLVNLIGSLAIGYLAITFANRTADTTQLRLLLIVGFLGGLTTFSSFSLETVQLIDAKRYAIACVYVALTNIGCVALALLAYKR